MIAVFSVFALLPVIDMKEMGIGLADTEEACIELVLGERPSGPNEFEVLARFINFL
jgi:hypothetical protein